jgi:hypothetical protein
MTRSAGRRPTWLLLWIGEHSHFRLSASARSPRRPRLLRTTSERADPPRATFCFALAERSSEQACPAQSVLVLGECLAAGSRDVPLPVPVAGAIPGWRRYLTSEMCAAVPPPPAALPCGRRERGGMAVLRSSATAGLGPGLCGRAVVFRWCLLGLQLDREVAGRRVSVGGEHGAARAVVGAGAAGDRERGVARALGRQALDAEGALG